MTDPRPARDGGGAADRPDESSRITVYSRPGCHLCEDALVALAPLAAAASTTVREVDIDRDDALLRAHLERIPVVLVDGAEVCTFFVDAPAVRAALDRRPVQ